MRNESMRSFIFVGLAIISFGAALFYASASQVKEPDFAVNVGKPFYPEFQDPNDASSLQVTVFEEDTAEIKQFSVEQKEGIWTIPSHHHYPAEGKERLAQTAASVLGVKRQALAGRRESDYKRLGVVDPLNSKASEISGIGKRITLRDSTGEILCDYIIGNSIEDKPNLYYIRKPDSMQTYITELKIDLSTNFSDWIEADFLKLEKDEIEDIILHQYSFDERRGRRVNEKIIKLGKEGSKWALEDLDAKTEELQQFQVVNLLTAIDQLKIVGIRPKPEGLSADLKLDEGIQLDRMTLFSLQSKGFYFQNFNNQLSLSSNKGDLIVSTNDGIQYTLHFGEVFTGTDFDIEAGLEDTKKKEESEPKKDEKEKETEGLTQSRYVFITVDFDPSALGEKPKKPSKPKAVEANKDAPTKKEATEKESSPKESSPEKKEEKPDAQFEYEQALRQYEAKLEEYDGKLKAAQERAKELRIRFADWYYVISAKSFDQLNIERSKLVKAIKKPAKPPALPPKETPSTTPAPTKKPSTTENGKPLPTIKPAKPGSSKPKLPKKPEPVKDKKDSPKPASSKSDSPQKPSKEAIKKTEAEKPTSGEPQTKKVEAPQAPADEK